MIPVICVDGPSGSGKGTLSQRLSEALGFNLLDSGALYRVVGFAASKQGVAWDDEPAVAAVARSLNVEFIASDLGVRVLYLGSDVTDEVRSVLGAEGASAVAALPAVRDALLSRQRELAVAPGLVADGRDMGTVVFPAAGYLELAQVACTSAIPHEKGLHDVIFMQPLILSDERSDGVVEVAFTHDTFEIRSSAVRLTDTFYPGYVLLVCSIVSGLHHHRADCDGRIQSAGQINGAVHP